MKLTYRLVIAFVLIAGVAFGLAAVLTGVRTNAAFQRFGADSARRYLDVVAEDVAAAYTRDGGFGDLSPSFVGGPSGRIDVVVADAQGAVVRPAALAGVAADGLGGERNLTVPIVVDGRRVGQVIAVRHPPGPGERGLRPRLFRDAPASFVNLEQRFVDETTRSLWIAFGVALGIAVLLAVIVSRSIGRPLAHLSEVAGRFARGERDARASVPDSGEIGRLSGAFNAMADSLDRQEAARRNLFADIAHELRTPLTVVEGNAQAMLDGVYERSDANLQGIVARTRGLTRLVEDVRDLSLAEVGQLSLELADVPVGPLITDVVQGMDRPAAAQGVRLSADIGSAGVARADGMRLRQVLGNLLDNAVRYTPDGGRVTVSAGPSQAGRIHIDIQDTGPGIAPEDVPRIFDRFHRSDTSRARASGGSGLGLAIVRALVTSMAGRVSVSSPPGGGAHFRVDLLAAAKPAD